MRPQLRDFAEGRDRFGCMSKGCLRRSQPIEEGGVPTLTACLDAAATAARSGFPSRTRAEGLATHDADAQIRDRPTMPAETFGGVGRGRRSRARCRRRTKRVHAATTPGRKVVQPGRSRSPSVKRPRAATRRDQPDDHAFGIRSITLRSLTIARHSVSTSSEIRASSSSRRRDGMVSARSAS